MPSLDVRDWFAAAATGCRSVVEAITPEQLDRPGLGEWDVRALLGHTSRSFLTIEAYLDPQSQEAPSLHGAAAYYRAALAGLADPAAVTERGRAAGRALGPDPVRTFVELATQVCVLVESSPAATVCLTPVGAMTLIDYLPTRAFELTVHGIDLARATEQQVPPALVDAVTPAVRLCAELAEPQQRLTALMALTGREPLPAGFSVL